VIDRFSKVVQFELYADALRAQVSAHIEKVIKHHGRSQMPPSEG